MCYRIRHDLSKEDCRDLAHLFRTSLCDQHKWESIQPCNASYPAHLLTSLNPSLPPSPPPSISCFSACTYAVNPLAITHPHNTEHAKLHCIGHKQNKNRTETVAIKTMSSTETQHFWVSITVAKPEAERDTQSALGYTEVRRSLDSLYLGNSILGLIACMRTVG